MLWPTEHTPSPPLEADVLLGRGDYLSALLMGCCAAASSGCRSTVLLLRLQGAMLLLLVSVVTMPGATPPSCRCRRDAAPFPRWDSSSRRPRILVVIEFLVMFDYLSYYFFPKLSYTLFIRFFVFAA
jgi:hypothetical protein